MYTTSIILLFFIFIYLLNAYIKSKRKKSNQKILIQENKKSEDVSKETAFYEQAVIAAVIATVMGDIAYSIRKVRYIPSVNEKESMWKVSGRNESMVRRIFFKK